MLRAEITLPFDHRIPQLQVWIAGIARIGMPDDECFIFEIICKEGQI
jgi:hypothetical protein